MTLTSIHPGTLKVVGTIDCTALDTLPALLRQTQAAQREWYEATTRDDIGLSLLRAREYLLDNIDALTTIICEETGKPATEALCAELYPIADLLYFYGTNAAKILGCENLPTGIMRFLKRRSREIHAPLGTVGVISPWNYPFSIPAGTIAMALAAGNGVLLKSSENTPLTASALIDMFHSAFPPALVQHIVGNGTAGRAVCELPLDKIFFTGSVPVGRYIMGSCATKLTPCQLELGGKDAMIVCSDADIDIASSGAVWGAFTNAGQVCASVERCYVDETIADTFIEAVVAKTQQLRQGLAPDAEFDVGPLITKPQLERVATQVDAAKRDGASILCGGQRNPDLAGYFYEPTVLTDVRRDMAIMREETFGPVLPIYRVRSDECAIELANDSPFGLCASIWSADLNYAEHMAEQLRVGTVTINETTYTHAIPSLPWGGCGDSGFGRTHGHDGLKEMTHSIHVHTNGGNFKSPWWFPYTDSTRSAFRTLARAATRGILWAGGALPALIRMLRRTLL